MPYTWVPSDTASDTSELHLWPHQSLPPKGLAASVLGAYTLILIPLSAVLGSLAFWGLLPFALLSVGLIWFALNRNYHDRRIMEVLTLSHDMAHLVRRNPKGDQQEWECNRYWVTPEMHKKDGPVPYYVTLRGAGREVEIGAFLSEEERIDLYDELMREIRPSAPRGAA